MKALIVILLYIFTIACGNGKQSKSSIQFITDTNKQDSIFNSLLIITNNTIPQSLQADSLAFLILPVQASCPACRKKTIDSIVQNKSILPKGRYIVISANEGRKSINGFFREQDDELPVIENKLFLDSTNQAYKYHLYDDKPTIYYTYNRKAVKKVSAIPSTVKEDLREFFSGYRTKSSY